MRFALLPLVAEGAECRDLLAGAADKPASGWRYLVVRAGLPRWIEVIVASLGLVLALPLLVLISVIVYWSSTGPVLFLQERVGRGGGVFRMVKFRTMASGKAGPRITSRGDTRVTAVGRVLRATKLDEVPELWNVVRGDMSLVGPRPEVPELVDLESPAWKRVLLARPGITDPVTLRLRDEELLLASSGLDAETFYREKLLAWKLRGYASYLERRSPWSDLGVLLATVAAVLRLTKPENLSVEEIMGEGTGW